MLPLNRLKVITCYISIEVVIESKCDKALLVATIRRCALQWPVIEWGTNEAKYIYQSYIHFSVVKKRKIVYNKNYVVSNLYRERGG